MKKLDKFILQSFIGPFILTFLVVVFILLMQHMLKYFDDIIGKGLDSATIGQLLFYFAIFMMPVSMPLAVLLSSLLTFGNLGEHFELTAIKASGVSLVRILRPIFFFVILLTGIAFYINNNLVPNAALEAYSLLYDIKQKKPALEIREGAFYMGIPDVSIKVATKFPEDDAALKDVLIYDHRKNDGNKEVTIADSGRMTTFMNKQYLKLELFNGFYYAEGTNMEREMTGTNTPRINNKETLGRTKFDKYQVVFDLSSFQMSRTDQKWFQSDRMMRNMNQLEGDMDSMNNLVMRQDLNYFNSKPTFFMYYLRHDSVKLTNELGNFKRILDSTEQAKWVDEGKVNNEAEVITPLAKDSTAHFTRRKNRLRKSPTSFKDSDIVSVEHVNSTVEKEIVASPVKLSQSLNIDSIINLPTTREHIQSAANYARQTKTQIANSNDSKKSYEKSNVIFEVQWHKILSNSLACIAMFLIGAPLGAIIKRGGLGVPFLVSILFFIIFYLLTMQGEKLAKAGVVSAWVGVWLADFVLLVIGLFFLRQARADTRLFEIDFYSVLFDKLKMRFSEKK